MADYGERLRDARVAAGMSQEDLANKVGMSQQMICRWEHCLSKVRMDVAIELARAVGVPASYLFSLDGEDALSQDEIELVSMYRRLDSDGKKLLREIGSCISERHSL